MIISIDVKERKHLMKFNIMIKIVKESRIEEMHLNIVKATMISPPETLYQ